MLTPQEVSNHAFSKAAFGGYNMSMVDEFLDELTDDYTSLYKENAALKAKLKVMVDKVEEYRATEDSMRAALLAAQKMANNMVEEAKAQKESLLADAESQAKDKIDALREEVALEQSKLNVAKSATSNFLSQLREMCEQHMALLTNVPDLTLEDVTLPAKAAAAPADVASIEEKILASFKAPETEEAAEPEPEPQSEPADEPTRVIPEPLEPDDSPFVDTATRAIDLSELKFGRNYRVDEQ